MHLAPSTQGQAICSRDIGAGDWIIGQRRLRQVAASMKKRGVVVAWRAAAVRARRDVPLYGMIFLLALRWAKGCTVSVVKSFYKVALVKSSRSASRVPKKDDPVSSSFRRPSSTKVSRSLHKKALVREE